MLGGTQIWVFQHPTQKPTKGTKTPEITYEYAQEEIAAKSGLNLAGSGDPGGQ